MKNALRKSLHINPENCAGCLQCEMAWSIETAGTWAPLLTSLRPWSSRADRGHCRR